MRRHWRSREWVRYHRDRGREADFAVFKTPDIEIGLTSLPWVDAPLVFLDTGDIEQARQQLIDSGATGLGEVADGSLADLGSAPVTNGSAETGIVEVPGARLAVVRADGTQGRAKDSRRKGSRSFMDRLDERWERRENNP